MHQSILAAKLAPSRFAPAPLPPRAGAGFKPQHAVDILESRPEIGFFEVHAENYMGAGGLPHAMLADIRERFPLSLHGVGMSIGAPGRIDREHLAKFRALVDAYAPGMVSEHLAWSTHDDVFYNDLLPLPYTNETLQRVCDHVQEVQEAIGRRILIENPSTYIVFAESGWSETDFLSELARRTGCGLLLDVNNVFVSAANHGYSPQQYIADFPLNLVGEIHLAGHDTHRLDDGGELLIDAHDREVCPDVWDLYAMVLALTGPLPSLVEWDNDLPAWPVLLEEVRKADRILAATNRHAEVA